MNMIQKLILKEHPNYDFTRYRYQAGDIVRTLDGALVVVEYSAIDYVSAFPVIRSLKYRNREFQRIPYSDLPYYKCGEFCAEQIKPKRKLKWSVGDIVENTNGDVVLLTKETHSQGFHGYVLQSEQGFYLHTGIYIQNPYRDYVVVEG